MRRALGFLADTALVACGYTLAMHGWLWTLLPIAAAGVLRSAAEEVAP